MIGLPPLAGDMGVGRQQQHRWRQLEYNYCVCNINHCYVYDIMSVREELIMIIIMFIKTSACVFVDGRGWDPLVCHGFMQISPTINWFIVLIEVQ